MSNAEPPAAPLLAIDTSTLYAGLAVYGAEGLLADVNWQAGRSQTSSLLLEIDRTLALAGLRAADLGALAVATGPGSFNALRVGLSTAKGLAFARGLPIVGVPTLDATAYPHLGWGRPVRAVLAAGRGRLASALYRWQGEEPAAEQAALVRAGDYENTSLEGLAALIVEPALLCGELDDAAAATLAHLAPLARIVAPASRRRRAGVLAELAWARLRRGEQDDPASLEPVYLHGPGG